MKKILFYILLGTLFISLIMTLTNGETIVFTFKNMLDLFAKMPKIDMSPLYKVLTSIDLSAYQWIPIIGTIIEISQSIMIGTIFILDCVVQVGSFVIYLVPRLFTGTV